MSFPQRNKSFLQNKNRKKNKFLPIIGVVFIILIFSFSWTRGILFTVGSPLWSMKNGVVSFVVNNIEVLSLKNSLLKENSTLRDQVKIKTKDRILLELLKQENDDLKNVLNRSKNNQKFILGAVLVKPFLSAYDTLIIDIGLSDGVGVGDKVVADGNIFIGYISEVYNNTSKVVLYSSPGQKINVLIGDGSIEKEAVGLGGGNFSVETPKEVDVKEGDTIIIPSISTNIFGVVEKIESKDSSSFQSILFKSPVNIAELKWVEIVTSNIKR